MAAAPPWRLAAGLIGAAALAATAACTESGGDASEATADPEVVDAAGLLEMANESVRLSKELDAAESRVIAECLEAQGFDVHDQRELGQNEPYEVASLVDAYPTAEFLPEADIAAEWGFGWWAQTAEMFDSEETQDYYAEAYPDPFADQPVFDNSEFESLPDDERRAWSVAYQGEEATAALEYTGEPSEEEASSEDGSLDFGDGETPSAPKPGGCQLEMITAIYGEPKQVEIDLDGGYLVWEWRPEQPEIEYESIEAEFAGRMADAEAGFLSCIDEAGYPGWEFDEGGRLAMNDYSAMLYTGEPFDPGAPPGEEPPVDTSPPAPDLPDDVPDDFEGKRAYEVDMAVAFAACGDDTGYREAATSAYDAVVAEQYAAIEVETYAWQDQIRDYTVKAQELIAG
ncbi:MULTISPECIES: hypothetical protein [Glycomyces]|uniref:Uncharacterized protein n=2 Tax=Glycomyces TaxID=58113 RepID=A0A9X3PMH2_9ACTN|nr:hypothetical protein [Glycomyces lechevalierae]MDA1386283.1 hypothetical protein [Glycomyces lechevalierae]MDR7338245.1 hypothetical protein [Glycomyces lechevalierae]